MIVQVYSAVNLFWVLCNSAVINFCQFSLWLLIRPFDNALYRRLMGCVLCLVPCVRACAICSLSHTHRSLSLDRCVAYEQVVHPVALGRRRLVLFPRSQARDHVRSRCSLSLTVHDSRECLSYVSAVAKSPRTRRVLRSSLRTTKWTPTGGTSGKVRPLALLSIAPVNDTHLRPTRCDCPTAARAHKGAGNIKIVLKEQLKYVPIIGWGMRLFEFLFLKRSIDHDSAHIKGPSTRLASAIASRVSSLTHHESSLDRVDSVHGQSDRRRLPVLARDLSRRHDDPQGVRRQVPGVR